ncbi:hypothetical protein AK812_SmicGene24130 [Symbiodinium microadriaticum]|uniref:Uncharacterized protein n=1 Tax=Symbiodinium microadriaticum TaxID=2951 RepID=A0A1Q9DFK8_SYMMI|nr:hypothetical protein AK812_SmicGene24130 [Symbiodinium microadriaticum]
MSAPRGPTEKCGKCGESWLETVSPAGADWSQKAGRVRSARTTYEAGEVGLAQTLLTRLFSFMPESPRSVSVAEWLGLMDGDELLDGVGDLHVNRPALSIPAGVNAKHSAAVGVSNVDGGTSDGGVYVENALISQKFEIVESIALCRLQSRPVNSVMCLASWEPSEDNQDDLSNYVACWVLWHQNILLHLGGVVAVLVMRKADV